MGSVLTLTQRIRFMGEEDWRRASMIPFLSAGLSISSSSWFESAGLWQARPSFHSLNQICSRSLYHQMKMIVHQAIGMKLPAGLLTRRTQGLEKTFSIQIVPKNLLTPIVPAHQMINSPLVLNSQLARHRQVLIQTCNLCH